MGRSSGQVVGMLAFYSDDPSSNPAEACSFYSVKICIRKGRKYKKDAGYCQFFRNPSPNPLHFFIYKYRLHGQ